MTDSEKVKDSRQTDCCVVGGGPGGMMLALLLARRGVKVALLEAHKDFDRDFRGDTVHPSTLEILDQICLAQPLHQLRHNKIYGPTLQASGGAFSPIDLRRLHTRFPYIMMVPQAKFLDFLASEARRFPSFELRMSARVSGLITEDGVVRGVRYRSDDGLHEVRAPLTVGADGRASMVRHLSGFEPVKTSPPMDIMWFRLPRLAGDESSDRVLGGFGGGRVLVVFDRVEYWQVAYVFPKGRYQAVIAAGLDEFRRSIVELEPQFAEHVKTLTEWHQCALLSVESSRCPLWHKPGLLLIGDAAHVMSPIAGVGINYAVQDAVVAANILTESLLAGAVKSEDLARVQKEREGPVRFIQWFQAEIQKRIIAPALKAAGPFEIPWFVRLYFRIPFLRDIPARILAFGLKRVRLLPPN